ncbi:MAG: FIST N-terminal domain-containing protein [Rubrivivax sp.]
MPQLYTAAASHADTAAALQQIDRQLDERAAGARMVFAFYGCEHDDALLHRHLRQRFGGAALLGGSSSGGLITERGALGPQGLGLLAIADDDGSYGVAAGALGADPAASAEALLRQALASCDCEGELPELIWVYQAPGHEEAVVAGLRRLVGDRCPIVGGSSADNDVSGRWRQLGPDGVRGDGLVVGVLFPSSPLGFAFQGGYEPAGPSGVITGIGYAPAGASGIVTASAGREILSIDGEPAAVVYNRWLGGRLDGLLAGGGTILAETTMMPIATDAGRVEGVSHYLLVHPEAVGAGGTLRTFCTLQVGDRVYAMRGDRERLIDRAGRVARQARKDLGRGATAGGLVVYCGGCKMAVGEDIDRVAAGLADAFGGSPFICCFTFGEQGRLIDRNVHGNLMISAIGFAH